MFPGLCCPCPKARLPVQGWHRSAMEQAWGWSGQDSSWQAGWGPCPVTAGCAGAGFLPPATKSAQSFSAWHSLLCCTPWCSHGHLGVGCSPGAMRSRDPSHHGISDLGVKPWTTRFPDRTTSPGNSQDLQRASAPGGASGKHLSMVGTPLMSHMFTEVLHAHTSPGCPWGCLHPALPSPHLLPDPVLPACWCSLWSLLFPVGDQNKHFCGEVHCSGARNK